MDKQNNSAYTVLGMLSITPMSGYDIKKTISESIAHFWSESSGQIYPALAALKKDQLIKTLPNKDQGRNKIIYSITKKGKQVLKAWLKEEPTTFLVRNELLLKIFFGRNLTVKQNKAHLQTYQQGLQEKLQLIQMLTKNIKASTQEPPELPFWLMILDYGKTRIMAELTWCKNTMKTLDDMNEPRQD